MCVESVQMTSVCIYLLSLIGHFKAQQKCIFIALLGYVTFQ